MRKATETSMGSAPSAAALRSLATTRHDALSRQYAGKCCSISSRTSASVTSFMTSEMISGRGSGRDQFGLGRWHSYATQTPARPENRPNRPGGRATDRRFSASSRVSSLAAGSPVQPHDQQREALPRQGERATWLVPCSSVSRLGNGGLACSPTTRLARPHLDFS
jgi:hypothetical protein